MLPFISRYYLSGACQNGQNCRFSYDQPVFIVLIKKADNNLLTSTF